MKENEVVMIPFVAHESAMNRMERANKRLWIVILVMFIGMMIYFFIPSEIVEDNQSVDNTTNSQINQSIGE
jgi:hypothetical protein